jgi:hypothetical protein
VARARGPRRRRRGRRPTRGRADRRDGGRNRRRSRSARRGDPSPHVRRPALRRAVGRQHGRERSRAAPGDDPREPRGGGRPRALPHRDARGGGARAALVLRPASGARGGGGASRPRAAARRAERHGQEHARLSGACRRTRSPERRSGARAAHAVVASVGMAGPRATARRQRGADGGDAARRGAREWKAKGGDRDGSWRGRGATRGERGHGLRALARRRCRVAGAARARGARARARVAARAGVRSISVALARGGACAHRARRLAAQPLGRCARCDPRRKGPARARRPARMDGTSSTGRTACTFRELMPTQRRRARQ